MALCKKKQGRPKLNYQCSIDEFHQYLKHKFNEAMKMIALCLADEMERMSLEERAFDLARYRMLLDLLPTMPE